MTRERRRAVLIAGPTASGKSARAMALAETSGGLIVNADSMQVYAGLQVLTARPDAADLARAPHRLYGSVAPEVRFSTGAYADAVRALLATPEAEGRALIFVGGTGHYFEALTKGIAEIPAVPAAMVHAVEAEIAELDAAARMRLLAAEDPQTAQRLKVADPQRVVRALAVKRATGRPLSAFADGPAVPVLEGFEIERLIVDPGRDVLNSRIAARFEAMLAQGAEEEVRDLLALGLSPGLPVMKAIGVPEIAAYLSGQLGRDEMIERAVIATRQYAKRQRTWLRNRMADWPRAAL